MLSKIFNRVLPYVDSQYYTKKEKESKKPITMEEIELYFINQFKIALAKIFEKGILMKREKENIMGNGKKEDK